MFHITSCLQWGSKIYLHTLISSHFRTVFLPSCLWRTLCRNRHYFVCYSFHLVFVASSLGQALLHKANTSHSPKSNLTRGCQLSLMFDLQLKMAHISTVPGVMDNLYRCTIYMLPANKSAQDSQHAQSPLILIQSPSYCQFQCSTSTCHYLHYFGLTFKSKIHHENDNY